MALIKLFETYEIQRFKYPKHSIFYSYVVWASRALVQDMWFGN